MVSYSEPGHFLYSLCRIGQNAKNIPRGTGRDTIHTHDTDIPQVFTRCKARLRSRENNLGLPSRRVRVLGNVLMDHGLVIREEKVSVFFDGKEDRLVREVERRPIFIIDRQGKGRTIAGQNLDGS